MLEAIFTFIKRLGVMTVLVAFLLVVSNAINHYLPWSWLTSFFVIIRHYASIFDFMIDTDTMFTVIGIVMILEVVFWVLSARVFILKFFNKR